ncbi:TolB family protein [Actinomycetota bacterium]
MVVRARSLDRFAVVVAAILLLSVVQGVDAPSAGATVPGEDGRIAYVSEVDGDLEIYSVNPDGSDPVNLTNAHTTASGPIDDHDPAWSPDGRRIAFTRSVMDPDADEPEIVSGVWVMDADGSDQALLIPDARSPTWSPDGKSIAYVAVGPANATDQTELIGVIDLVTQDSRFVTSPGTVSSDYKTVITADRSPVWSPDGTTIYFTRFGCPATPISCFTDLMAVEPDTGLTSTVVAHASRSSWSLDVSPDGRWLVSVDAGIPVPPQSVVLRDLTTIAETRLNMGTTVTGSAFSPSGERLAVGLDVSSMTRPSWVWTMDLDGMDRMKVAQGWDPAWQPVNPYPFGLVDPQQGQWHLRYPDGHVSTFYYGNPGDVPFLGDWDCDGVDTPGLYRQSDGYVYLRNSNTQGTADIKFFFGNPGDIPIAGDFNGDGCSTVSVYRPGNQTFYIINEIGDDDTGLGAADVSYVFGNPGDKPFVGDFDGDGTDTIGLHRESTGLVYYRNTHTQGNADAQFVFGNPGDRLVANDWNDDGNDSPAIFRPANTTVYLRFTNTQGNADAQFMFGQPDWLPVTGVFE